MPDLSTTLAGLHLANPTLTCSGTCGYADEYADFLDFSQLGAFVTKSITLHERPGNAPARIVETRAGNAQRDRLGQRGAAAVSR